MADMPSGGRGLARISHRGIRGLAPPLVAAPCEGVRAVHDFCVLAHWTDAEGLPSGEFAELPGSTQNVMPRVRRGGHSYVLRHPTRHPRKDSNAVRQRGHGRGVAPTVWHLLAVRSRVWMGDCRGPGPRCGGPASHLGTSPAERAPPSCGEPEDAGP